MNLLWKCHRARCCRKNAADLSKLSGAIQQCRLIRRRIPKRKLMRLKRRLQNQPCPVKKLLHLLTGHRIRTRVWILKLQQTSGQQMLGDTRKARRTVVLPLEQEEAAKENEDIPELLPKIKPAKVADDKP